MKLIIHSNSSLEITRAMRNYIEDATKLLDKIIPENSFVTCSCKQVSKKEKGLEIMICNKEYRIRAETYCTDFYDAVDKSFDKVILSARKYHKKMLDIKKRNRKKTYKNIEKNQKVIIDDNLENNIRREKKVIAVAMSSESAILQLELLDHDFFMYLDSNTLEPCIVYKRKDVGYGLIKLIKENLDN